MNVVSHEPGTFKRWIRTFVGLEGIVGRDWMSFTPGLATFWQRPFRGMLVDGLLVSRNKNMNMMLWSLPADHT